MFSIASSPHVEGMLECEKLDLSHINKIKGFKYVYKLVSHATHCQ